MKITYKSDYRYTHLSGNITLFLKETKTDYSRCITYNPTNLMVVGFCISLAAVRQWKKLCTTDSNSVKRNRQTVTLSFEKLVSESFPTTQHLVKNYANLMLSDSVISNSSSTATPKVASVILNGLQAPSTSGSACTERYNYGKAFNLELEAGKELFLVEWLAHHSFHAKRGCDQSETLYENGGKINGTSFQGPAQYISNAAKAARNK